jgi:hypothetical protein
MFSNARLKNPTQNYPLLTTFMKIFGETLQMLMRPRQATGPKMFNADDNWETLVLYVLQ